MRFEGNHAPFGANMANDFMRLEDWVDKLWKTNRFHAHPCERPHESWLNSRNGEVRGIPQDKEVIAHCQTGQRSAVAYWVLRLLGYPQVGNYAGSWVEWGNDPTLWCADGSRFKHAIVHNPRREKLLDQTENVAISYPFSHRLHNDRLREVIEKSLNVRIYDVAEAFIMEFQSRLDRHVAVPVMAETIRGGMKQRFKDRIQKATDHLLSHAISNGWNAERAELRLIFRNEMTSKRVGLKRT